jgi:hypothetical protein
MILAASPDLAYMSDNSPPFFLKWFRGEEPLTRLVVDRPQQPATT